MARDRIVRTIFKEKKWWFIRDLIGITIGTAIAGFAFAVFLIPFKAAPGGVSSLSQILYYLFGIPAGTAMLMFNVPLFFLGVATLGRMFGFKTIYAILAVGIFTDLFSPNNLAKLHFPILYRVNEHTFSMVSEPFLGVVAGGILLGAGLGLVFRNNGSCGSTDIPALLLKKYFGVTVGTGYLMIDTFIIMATGLVFKNGNLILWGLVALFITSKVADYVIQGFPSARGVFIISDRHEEIKAMILNDINRGCTVFKGEGGYTGKPRNIIYTVTQMHELVRLKNMVRQVDSTAFIIVGEVQEVHGEGFKALT